METQDSDKKMLEQIKDNAHGLPEELIAKVIIAGVRFMQILLLIFFGGGLVLSWFYSEWIGRTGWLLLVLIILIPALKWGDKLVEVARQQLNGPIKQD